MVELIKDETVVKIVEEKGNFFKADNFWIKKNHNTYIFTRIGIRPVVEIFIAYHTHRTGDNKTLFIFSI